MSDIGTNFSGVDQKIILGKEIGKFGKTNKDKENALNLAAQTDGSEIVYQDNNGKWTVQELKEEGVVYGADNLSKKDANDIFMDPKKLKEAGINNPVISYMEDQISFPTKPSGTEDITEIFKKVGGVDLNKDGKLDVLTEINDKRIVKNMSDALELGGHDLKATPEEVISYLNKKGIK